MLQCSFLPGLFLYQIHWTCNLVLEDFLHRDSSKFVAFLASSGMSFDPSIFIDISRWQNTAIHLKHFIAVMAVIGSRGSLPINFGTPGLICLLSFIIKSLIWSTNIYQNWTCNFFPQVGLALSYAAPIVSLLGSFLSSFTETEKEMVSVERTLQVWIRLISLNWNMFWHIYGDA